MLGFTNDELRFLYGLGVKSVLLSAALSKLSNKFLLGVANLLA